MTKERSATDVDIDVGLEACATDVKTIRIQAHTKANEEPTNTKSREFDNLRKDVQKLQDKVDQLIADKIAQQATFETFRASIDLKLVDLMSNQVTKQVGEDEVATQSDAANLTPIVINDDSEKKEVDGFAKQESKELAKKNSFSYNSADYEKAKDSSWIVREQMYEWSESVWDSSLFAWATFLKPMDSFFLMLMFLVNLGMQTCLTFFSFSPFTKKAFTQADVDNLREWRTVVAHDARWSDAITQQSLARLVCSSSQAPYLSGSTKVTKDALISYSPNSYFGEQDNFFHIDAMGEALCILTLIIWWFTCYIEIRNWFYCFQAVFMLPNRNRSQFFLVKPGDIDDIGIGGMSAGRKCWCFVVLMLRILVAVVLAYMGTLFLVYTVSLRELILNAVALELMLNIDELIYSTMAPFKVRHFISCLEPVPKMRNGCTWRGIDFDTPLVIISLSIAMLLTYPFMDEQSNLMSAAVEEVCGGYLDFVYTLDPGGAVAAHPTPIIEGVRPLNVGPSGGVIVDQEQTYRWLAIRELITDADAVTRNPTNSLSDGASALSGSALGLQERPWIPIGDRMSDLNPLCDDWSLSGSTLVWPVDFIAKLYPSHPVFGHGGTCQDGFKYCNWDNKIGIAMRQWCSSTCGCGGANSSLILSKKISGCPNSCLELPYYKATLAQTPCNDSSSTSQAFQDYVAGMRSLRESYKQQKVWYTMFGQWIDGLDQDGCNGHQLVFGAGNFGSLCGNTAFGLKPIVNVCPVTCKCTPSTKMPKDQPPLCPTTCLR